MDKLFSWFDHVSSFLLSLFPHIVIVNADCEAVKYSGGKHVRVLKPGVHWYWPIVTDEPTQRGVKRDASVYGTQKLTTSDGRQVAISVVLVHRTVDIRRALFETADIEGVMHDLTSAACLRSTMSRDWQTCRSDLNSGVFQAEVKTSIRTELQRYGIEVLDVKVKDAVETFVLSLIGDGFLTGATPTEGD